jgi:predicted O-linked N-acetylglucosamine transferase (SPINDLY family)
MLYGLRAKLARNRLTVSLFDTERFCRHIETAYEEMMRVWDDAEEPRDIHVSSKDS